ncbi:MAG: hypothetical protein HY551_04285 [Elusimicrobia bacterium]|nr:hypothetical protein [Elusimicrobiota bacterium]
MSKKLWVAFLCVLLLSPAGTLWSRSQDSPSRRKAAKGRRAAPAAARPALTKAKHGGNTLQARLEEFLRKRQAQLERDHKARMDFMARETELWTGFWSKVFEERSLFEVRIARQRLDTLESLASLDGKDRESALSDFEKLQVTQIKSFEDKQQRKMQEFFAQRQSRLKDFEMETEQGRAALANDAYAQWQAQRAGWLKLDSRGAEGGPSNSAREERPAEEGTAPNDPLVVQ